MKRSTITVFLSALAISLVPMSSSGAARNPALPIAARTPGAIDPHVTQANISSTICVTGYTTTVRPSSSYTRALKISQLASGYALGADRLTSHYEEDHLISLELGGSPSAPSNLWPEPYAIANGARTKDTLENALHRLVCARVVPLAVAQRAIATNWIAAYSRYVG
jgi:hypothetical protein